MSILKKPYEISVWEDRWDSDQGKFVEVRLGIIGTDKMIAQCRAIEPNLVRNVNGTKKFSFKMYKQYVDIMTGEKVSNPFSDWLISERKVKLHYEDKWFDFIIKDVAENSSNYLCTYQLEDALMQELSKNGFGVALDAQLMNNMGTAGELGAKVLEETDWTVQSEVFVQKVEEALVYISIPYSDTIKYKKVIDQTNLSFGITTEEVIFSQPTDTVATSFTALAFYSSCTEQPYRFQFIKLNSYADVTTDENRVINVVNCQYYYDVFAAGKTYTKTNEGFYLPTGWTVLDKGPNKIDDKNDTTVSNWYRGARYGFAQDAEYVPLLDRYCQKFQTKGESPIAMSGWTGFLSDTPTVNGQNITIPITQHAGGLQLTPNNSMVGNVYKLNISFSATGNTPMTHIGAHLPPERFKQLGLCINGRKIADHISEGFEIENSIGNNSLELTFQVFGTAASQDFLCIQPNRGHYLEDEYDGKMSFQVTINSFEKIKYAFVDNTYASPALVYNVISSPNGEKTSGWTAATTVAANGDKTKPEIESVYGRFDGSNFISIIDDLQGAGTAGKTYKSYLKVKFTDANQRLINSGFYDNRTLIGSVTTGEKWVLKPELIGTPTLNYSLNEVVYNTTGGYHEIKDQWASYSYSSGIMTFSRGTGVSEKEFKKKKIKLVITSSTLDTYFYIENLELYRAVEIGKNENDQPIYMSPGELDESGIITTTYNFFSPAVLETVETAEELACEKVDKSELYTKYTPVFNENAEKVRSVTVKESNYFNILQSIAETFECWLSLEVGRSADGAITSKVAKFKNYAGNDNYAAFRYGVNLKDIQRTYTSKNIVTKLMVKANSNEHAQDGFCTVQRAGANPTGESYLYDFQYYHNKGLLRAEDFIHVYYIDGATGPDLDPDPDKDHSTDEYNLNGYYPRLKALNNLLLPINQSIIDLNTDLTTLRAEEAVEEGLYYAAKEGIEEVREDFKTLTCLDIDKTSPTQYTTIECIVSNNNSLNSGKDWAQDATIDSNSADKKVWTFTITLAAGKQASAGDEFYFQPTFVVKEGTAELTTKSPKLSAKFNVSGNSIIYEYELKLVEDGSKARDLQNQFAQYTIQLQNSLAKLGKEPDSTDTDVPEPDSIKSAIAAKEAALITKEAERDKYLAHKKALNKLFFEKYSRFIQEGTWISEEYVDDDKYYIDAQSVLYNSCYPQVAYTINVLALSRLPGYELFEFGLGDKTYAEDPEFFEAEGGRVEVIISEKNENLDDPTKDVIRVQNFKNQFQDLFQKITATVQQTQYSTGAYKKAVALAEADVARKGEFLSDALSDANAKLSAAGQTSVKQDIDGITLTDSKTNDKMRLIGGAILMGVLDENGERQWKTGLTPEGISASLVTAGTINTGSIAIMDGNNPAFRWDAFGISAFNADWDANGIQGTSDKTQFVRFDKYGIYGINGGVDGTSWRPGVSELYDGKPFDEIDDRSTFALTWEGLKVTGNNGGVVKIGKHTIIPEETERGCLFSVKRGDDTTFAIYDNGDVTIGGGSEDDNDLDVETEEYSWLFSAAEGMFMWNGRQSSEPIFKVDTNGATLAGWNVTPNALWHDGTNNDNDQNFNNIGKQNTFGIYPKGLDDLPAKEIEYSWTFSYSGDFYHDLLVELNDEKYLYSGRGNSIVSHYHANLGEYWYREKADTLRWRHDPDTSSEIVPVDASQYTILTREQGEARIEEGGDLVVVNKNQVTATTLPHFKGTLEADDAWVLTAGDSFGVTKKGVMFANAGKIGTMTIDAISNLPNQVVGKNLAKDSQNGKLIGFGSDYERLQCQLSETLNNNAEYLVSIWIENSDEKTLTTTLTNGNTSNTQIYSLQTITCKNGYGFAKVSKNYNGQKDISAATHLEVYKGESGNTNSAIKILKVKLEKGNMGTDWCPADADAMQASVNNNFSWKFSSTEGMFMWNGAQGAISTSNPTGDAVFAVYNDPDTKEHKLFVKGDIEADGGKIGGYWINQDSLFSNYITIKNNSIRVTGTSDNGIIFNGLSIKNVDDSSTLIFASPSLTLTGGTDGAEIVLDNRGSEYSALKFVPYMYQSASYGYIYIKITEITNLESWRGRDIYLYWHFYIPDALFENNRNLSGSYKVNIPTTVKVGDIIQVTDPDDLGLKLHDIFNDYVGIADSAIDATKMAQNKGYLVNTTTTQAMPREFPVMQTAYYPPTQQIKIKGNLLATTKNSSIGANGEGRWNTIYCQECQQGIDWSDARKKNSIQPLDERYEVFFDKIKPTRYKYNQGTSNRYHTGFIAQPLVASLEESGLTTLDFAAVCLEEKGTENECWYLRRDEFVALNTWQIQKLKPRVSTLEQTILDYEARISTLEQQVQSLTS